MTTLSQPDAQAANALRSDGDTDAPEISLLDLLTALGERKGLFIGITVLGTAVALAIALLVPRYYSASTLILPPQQQQSAAAGALAQLGSLAGVAGAAAGIKTPDEMYVALLKSRRLQDVLIQRFKLQERYEQKTLMDTRQKLAGKVAISADKKSGLISIVVDDLEPAFAAELANAHVSQLRVLLSSLAVTDAQQRRQFFEQEVNKTKEALSTAELAFRDAQAKGGMVVSEALAESGIKAGVEVRSQIAAREVQLQAISRFATAQHPEAQRLAAELTALKRQLSRLEQGGDATDNPGRGMEAVQAYRSMKVQMAALDALIRQFEIAKLDEAREGPLLQQVDAAIPPERPTKPRRIMILLAGAAMSLLAGVVVAIASALVARPGSASQRQWRVLTAAWTGSPKSSKSA